MKKSGSLASHVLNSNFAINSLPTLQISRYLKRYDEQLIFTVFSNIGEDVNTVVSVKWMM
jgi:hypothetical protein